MGFIVIPRTSFRPQISWGFPVFFLEPKKKKRIPIKKPPNFRRVFGCRVYASSKIYPLGKPQVWFCSFSGGVFLGGSIGLTPTHSRSVRLEETLVAHGT